MVGSIDDKLDRLLRIMEGGLRKKATNGFIIKEMLIKHDLGWNCRILFSEDLGSSFASTHFIGFLQISRRLFDT